MRFREGHHIGDTANYLARLAKPLQEKLRVARYISPQAKTAVDVGCADGTLTIALARMFPKTEFLGIDLNADFIAIAAERARRERIKNVRFERIYLRELLARPGKFDVVTFVSVLHEFYTYGEGISSVVKALADAHELLRLGGEVVICDMITSEYSKRTRFQVEEIAGKISSHRGMARAVRDFECAFGKMKTLHQLNHFLLKYIYFDDANWPRECRENYVPVTFEEYEAIFRLLGMDLQLKDTYLIEFLRRRWEKDFRLSRDELVGLKSTGFLVAKKEAKK